MNIDLSNNTKYDRALDFTLAVEGGVSDDPRDLGGYTKAGISLLLLKLKNMDLDGDGIVTRADVDMLSDDQIRDIYKEEFWDRIRGDDLPAAVAYLVFDTAVNTGPRDAATWLQMALCQVGMKVEVDGRIGEQETIPAVNEWWSRSPWDRCRLLARFNAQRALERPRSKSYATHGAGWFWRDTLAVLHASGEI